jgi:hypothetical protein
MGTGSFPGLKRPGRDADPTPPSSAVGHERVELYLYSPRGSYGLYRASVPVQGCTSHFFLNQITGKSVQWERDVPYERTDKKLIVAFRSSVNASKNP